MSAVEAVVVQQCDRDMWADHLEEHNDYGTTYDEFRRGECDDHPDLQFVARVRIAAIDALAANVTDAMVEAGGAAIVNAPLDEQTDDYGSSWQPAAVAAFRAMLGAAK